MYEFVKLGEKTGYMECPTRVGFYLCGDGEVCLFDSGNNPDAGKKALKICDAFGWKVKCILNTHAHADHTGGNALIQKRTGCKIFCPGIDCAVACEPYLNVAYCFGARPIKEMHNKFLLAEKSVCEELKEDTELPSGIRAVRYDGHSFAQCAYFCDDGTCFTGDILCGAETMDKYHIFFIQDAEKYIDSVNRFAAEAEASVFCASHYAPIYKKEELCALCEKNIAKLAEICSVLKEICREGCTFDDAIGALCRHYGLELSANQYCIAGSTVKGLLGYLADKGELGTDFSTGRFLWKTV